MKKLFSLLLIPVLLLAMSVTTFAAGEGSITIENATPGNTYRAYKVFDATYTNGNANANYSIENTSPWYSIVTAAGSPFTLVKADATDVTNPITYYVTATNASLVIAWFQAIPAASLPSPNREEVAASTTVTWTAVDYGYYMVTNGVADALITITNADPHTKIIDKNDTPGWEDPDGTAALGKSVSADGTTWGPTSTASIDDTAYFRIDAFVPIYAGPDFVYKYIFTDTLDPGFTFNNDLAVKLNGTAITAGTDYTLVVTGQVIKVTLNVLDITPYPVKSVMNITFSAKVNTGAVYDNVNTVEMDWTLCDPGDDQDNNPATPPKYGDDDGTPDDGDPLTPPLGPGGVTIEMDNEPGDEPLDVETNTYVYGFNIQKYKGSADTGNELNGAEFKLFKTDGTTEIKVVLQTTDPDGTKNYRVAAAGETGVVIEAGKAKVFGLAGGITYYLKETKAPAGYNLLAAPQPVMIAAANDTTPKDGIMDAVIKIVNLAGSVLPETGGIGTTVFYAGGGLLMAAAVVLLVTKKKMTAIKSEEN